VTAARRRARPSPATRDGLTTDDGRDGRRESPCLTTAAHVAHHGDAYTVSVGQGSGHTHTPLLGTVASGPGGPPGLLMSHDDEISAARGPNRRCACLRARTTHERDVGRAQTTSDLATQTNDDHQLGQDDRGCDSA
jgi:hypothetical protein